MGPHPRPASPTRRSRSFASRRRLVSHRCRRRCCRTLRPPSAVERVDSPQGHRPDHQPRARKRARRPACPPPPPRLSLLPHLGRPRSLPSEQGPACRRRRRRRRHLSPLAGFGRSSQHSSPRRQRFARRRLPYRPPRLMSRQPRPRRCQPQGCWAGFGPTHRHSPRWQRRR